MWQRWCQQPQMPLHQKEGTLLVLPVSCGDYVDLGRYLAITILFHFLCRQSYVNKFFFFKKDLKPGQMGKDSKGFID